MTVKLTLLLTVDTLTTLKLKGCLSVDICDCCYLLLQLEKQTALLENEKQKMEDLQTAHEQALDTWQQTIGPRQQVIIV